MRESMNRQFGEVREAVAALKAKISKNDLAWGQLTELRDSMSEFRESIVHIQARISRHDSTNLFATLEAFQNNMDESQKKQQASMQEMRRDLDRELVC